MDGTSTATGGIPQDAAWPRAIVHVDMDTFFVSVERMHDPSLAGKPVIVGGGADGDRRRGVVAACSYETRVFGVRSAMPLSRALRLCPQAILIPVGRSDYAAETEKVRQTIESFTDFYEMTSPDEAYVDLEGTERLHGPPLAAADSLRNRIAKRTGLPVSVGLGASRTIAKIASKLSKPQGLFAILPGAEAAMLRPLAMRAMPGLGPKTEARLKELGLATIGDLLKFGEAKLAELFGEHGADLHRRARGEGSAAVVPARERHQISTEDTYGEDLAGDEAVAAELGRMTMKLGAALRRRGVRAGTIALKIRYPDFTTLTRQAPLRPETHDDRVLFKKSREILARAWNGTPLRLLGVGVSDLSESYQEELFSAAGGGKEERLLSAMDSIREEMGKGKILWGSAIPAKPGRRSRRVRE